MLHGFILSILLLPGSPVFAQKISFLETANVFCAEQVSELKKHSEKTWNSLSENYQFADDSFEPTQLAAYAKYGAFLIVAADQMNDPVVFAAALKNEEPISQAMRNSYKARLDAVKCLLPDLQDRKQIRQLARRAAELEDGLPDRGNQSRMIAFLKQYDCARWIEASERIYALNPEMPDGGKQAERVFEDTLGRCVKES